jgi:hypothetical protein
MKKQEILVPVEIIENKILLIRGKKVMLDRDLAFLYGVETKQLKRAINRNIERFPLDFMFKLNQKELKNLRCQFGTSSWGGQRYLPYVFTEQGVAMLSSVLNSPRAIRVNIQIMRTFTRLREIMLTHKDLQRKIEDIVRKQENQGKQITAIIEVINKFFTPEEPPKKRYGFIPNSERNK